MDPAPDGLSREEASRRDELSREEASRRIDEFPTYAELTQTQAWAGGAPPVPVGTALRDYAETTGSRYTESAVLGTGGMGRVLLAKDERIGREVAVKVLHSERQLSDEQRARFLREAQVQGQLEHPAIVPVYDIDQRADGSTFFTMRRVFGKTLQRILEDVRHQASGKRYTQRELLQAFATVCLAVDYAHTRGVIHRDLKPANIMLGEFGEVYVLDWGVARVLDSSATEVKKPPTSRLSQPGMLMGTPLYMAPEQMANPEVDARADVFSLGAILFELLTYERLRMPHTLYDPVEARPSVRLPNLRVAPELEAICVKATHADPDERYPTARALQEAIARYLEGDRELEQRRLRANEHAARARSELASEQPKDELAMGELARALALDPSNIEHVAMMSDVLASPPRVVPPEIHHRIDENAKQVIHEGAKYSAVAILSWFTFLPLLFLLGIRRPEYLVVIGVPVAVTAGLALYARAQPTVTRSVQYAMLVTNTLACMALSRLFGPLVIMPSMFATWAIVIQAHPHREIRIAALVAALVGMVLPVVLEAVGVLPASYRFTAGFEVVPQLVDFPAGGTIVFLTCASVAIMVVPALFVGRLRAALLEAERRELLQTWRIRQLGESLLRAQ